MLEVCASSLLWSFLPVGGVGQVACKGFLIRKACVGVLVELDFFSVECNEVSNMSFEVSMDLL